MGQLMVSLLVPGALFLGILLFVLVGRRIGLRRLSKTDGGAAGLGVVESAIFGLMGLLIAFTFSGAASRFDVRRELIVKETNSIGTAYLRLDLLDQETRGLLQEKFRQYLDSRIDSYRKIKSLDEAETQHAHSLQLQQEIWNLAVSGAQKAPTPQAMMLLVPALNEMFDIVTTRTMALFQHPPLVVFLMMGVLIFVCSLLVGCGLADAKRTSWIHLLGFAAIMSVTVYVIFNLEYPRLGIISLGDFDLALVSLRQSMG